MKRRLFTAICALVVLSTTAIYANDGRHFFVSPAGTGDGSSWQQAHANLSRVLATAREGDRVWVAAGIYVPTTEGDRHASFIIPDGVQVFGGFTGYETTLEERSVVDNLTILSGDIGEPVNPADNSYTVVLFQAVTQATVLDGFHITGGQADATIKEVDYMNCGGGIFVEGWDGGGPVIRNCIIRQNYASHGGGLYVYAKEGAVAPVLLNCAFQENQARSNGGGMMNNSRLGNCETVLRNCHFIANEALYGAGMANQRLNGQCIITLNDCHFQDNFAGFRDGAIRSKNEGAGVGKVVFSDCTFQGNTSTVGRDADEEDYREGTGTVTF